MHIVKLMLFLCFSLFFKGVHFAIYHIYGMNLYFLRGVSFVYLCFHNIIFMQSNVRFGTKRYLPEESHELRINNEREEADRLEAG